MNNLVSRCLLGLVLACLWACGTSTAKSPSSQVDVLQVPEDMAAMEDGDTNVGPDIGEAPTDVLADGSVDVHGATDLDVGAADDIDDVVGVTDAAGVTDGAVITTDATAGVVDAEPDVPPVALVPAKPGKLLGVVALDLNTCVWDADGIAYCWGENSGGELGPLAAGSSAPEYLPVPVTITSTGPVVQVAGDNSRICAVGPDGKVRCWGGEYGFPDTASCDTSTAMPTLQEGLSNVIELVGTSWYMVAVTSTGAAVDFGFGTPLWECDYCCEPHIESHEEAKFVGAATGGSVACAVAAESKVFCWGNNGTILSDSAVDASICEFCVAPTDMGVAGALEVAVGTSSACVLKEDGKVICFGSIVNGILGTGDSMLAQEVLIQPADATPVTGLSDVVQISGNHMTFCALDSSGEVWCWGDSDYGTLGNGSYGSSAMPVQVVLPASATHISMSNSHGCALLENNDVWCWGWNFSGQLGNGKTVPSGFPVRVKFGL